jgi:hypothetical protein
MPKNLPPNQKTTTTKNKKTHMLKLGMVAHICNTSTWEAEAGR